MTDDFAVSNTGLVSLSSINVDFNNNNNDSDNCGSNSLSNTVKISNEENSVDQQNDYHFRGRCRTVRTSYLFATNTLLRNNNVDENMSDRQTRLNQCKEDIDKILTGNCRRLFEICNEIDDIFASNVQQARHNLSVARAELQKRLDHVKVIKRAKLKSTSRQIGFEVNWLIVLRKLQCEELINSLDQLDNNMLKSLLELYENDENISNYTSDDQDMSEDTTSTLNFTNDLNLSSGSSLTSMTDCDSSSSTLCFGLDRRIDIGNAADLAQSIRLSRYLISTLEKTSSKMLLNCIRRRVRNYMFRMNTAEHVFKRSAERKSNKRPVRNAHRTNWRTTPIPMTYRKPVDMSAPQDDVVDDLQAMSVPKFEWIFNDNKGTKVSNSRRTRLTSSGIVPNVGSTQCQQENIDDNTPLNLLELYPVGSEVFVEFGLTDSFLGVIAQVSNSGISVQFGKNGDKIAFNASALIDKRVVVYVFENISFPSTIYELDNNQNLSVTCSANQCNPKGKRRPRRGALCSSHRSTRRT